MSMKLRKALSSVLAAAMVLSSGVFGTTAGAERISGVPDNMPVLSSSGPFDNVWDAADSVGSKPVTTYHFLWDVIEDGHYINDEGPWHLFGGNPAFYCTTDADVFVGIHAETDHPVPVNGIVLATGADSENCPGRAPAEWVLSGLNVETEEWDFLAYGTADFVGDTNGKYYAAPIAPNGSLYQEFAFDMQGSDGDGVKVLSAVYVLSDEGTDRPLIWDVNWDEQELIEKQTSAPTAFLAAGFMSASPLMVDQHFEYGTGSYPGEGPENLWDRSMGSKFCTICPAEFGAPAISAVSLDEPYSIDGILIATANDSHEMYGRLPHRWLLAGSNDGENWDVIVAGDENFFWVGGEGEDEIAYTGNFTYFGAKFAPTEPYRFFRFEADKFDWDVFQFSEIVLCSDEAPDLGPYVDPPVGYTAKNYFDGHTYYLYSNTNITWEEANQFAFNQGIDLAVVNSEEEDEFLKQWIMELNSAYFRGDWLWLGGRMVEGEWAWVNEDPFEYTGWYPGEPNNPEDECYLGYIGGPVDVDDEYVIGWNDYINDERGVHGFILEANVYTEWTEYSGRTVYDGEKAYSLYYSEKSWDEAREAAERMGGYLVTITDEREKELVYSLIGDDHMDVWIGLTADIDAEGNQHWYWITGEEVDFTDWRKLDLPDRSEDEPNNLFGRERCVEIINDEYACGWNDNANFKFNPFIVEYDTVTPDVREMDGHYYVLCNGLYDWHDARDFCERVGGHLMTVTSEEEQNLLREIAHDRRVWLGATDEHEENDWQWITGEPFDYAEWDFEQPDNCGESENYLGTLNEARWNDFAPQPWDIGGFVCEFEPDSFCYPNSGYSGDGELLTGTLIGDELGWAPEGEEKDPDTGRAAAFDGNILTYFDPQAMGGDHYVGMDLGSPYILTGFAVASRLTQINRLNGAQIQGSNDGETWTTVYRFGPHFCHPLEYMFFTADNDGFENNIGYSMYRYYNEENHGDVAELEFYGTPGTAITFEFDAPKVAAGDVFEVNITLTEPTEIKSILFEDFTFDRNAFELDDAEWLYDGAMEQWDADAESAIITFNRATLLQDSVLKLTMYAKEDIEDGDYTITCSTRVEVTTDGINHLTDAAAKTGTIQVETVRYLPGDMNCDDHVDSDDAIYLLRHTLNPGRYPIFQNGDVNGDGNTDSDDAIYLLRHTLNPTRYPLYN